MPDSQNDNYLNPARTPKFVLFRIAKSNRALTLLAALFLQIILQPLDRDFPILSLLVQVGLIFSVIFMVADCRSHLVVGLGLGIPAILLLIISHEGGYSNITWTAYLLTLALYSHVIRLMMMQIFKAVKITSETIVLAMCTYILLGTFWTLLYIPVAVLIPDSFVFTAVHGGESLVDQLNYFSFVTLTTLGYGDILPVASIARSLAILESVTGTLFIAVLISRLVGSYSSNRRKD